MVFKLSLLEFLVVVEFVSSKRLVLVEELVASFVFVVELFVFVESSVIMLVAELLLISSETSFVYFLMLVEVSFLVLLVA